MGLFQAVTSCWASTCLQECIPPGCRILVPICARSDGNTHLLCPVPEPGHSSCPLTGLILKECSDLGRWHEGEFSRSASLKHDFPSPLLFLLCSFLLPPSGQPYSEREVWDSSFINPLVFFLSHFDPVTSTLLEPPPHTLWKLQAHA